MYFPDHSKYTYFKEAECPMVNIGWLDANHPFPQGLSDEAFLENLFNLCRMRMHQTLGWHQCEFCKPVTWHGITMSREGVEINLVSAEIHVQGKNGIVYAAPNLIYHYVVDHHYCPPVEFIEAVNRTSKRGKAHFGFESLRHFAPGVFAIIARSVAFMTRKRWH